MNWMKNLGSTIVDLSVIQTMPRASWGDILTESWGLRIIQVSTIENGVLIPTTDIYIGGRELTALKEFLNEHMVEGDAE